MPRRGLDGLKDEYDVVVVGAGLAGLTAANVLARAGHRVLVLEQHYRLGGLATWFRRGPHIFDIALHGFPVGMKKTCRKYWSTALAERIVPLEGIRFDNPQFSFTTRFDRTDFTSKLVDHFGIAPAVVQAFFDTARGMNFYDDDGRTTAELFERFFPGRNDVQRLLMEPISYANGSTLDDPAITYGIVFSNFMSQGVYTFQGGTKLFLELLDQELARGGADVRIKARVLELVFSNGRLRGLHVAGHKCERFIGARAVVSNANLKTTILEMLPPAVLPPELRARAEAVRINNSSCQVYLGLKKDAPLAAIGDLIFTSAAPRFSSEGLLDPRQGSRTFSVYYPTEAEGYDRPAIVSSTNAHYHDWTQLNDEDYRAAKRELCERTIRALERYVPQVRDLLDHVEAATPRSFEHFTLHLAGASFGTKFEGLAVSRDLPQAVPGVFHAGSVGIIMSGWLGAANYGVIVANEVDKFLAVRSLRSSP